MTCNKSSKVVLCRNFSKPLCRHRRECCWVSITHRRRKTRQSHRQQHSIRPSEPVVDERRLALEEEMPASVKQPWAHVTMWWLLSYDTYVPFVRDEIFPSVVMPHAYCALCYLIHEARRSHQRCNHIDRATHASREAAFEGEWIGTCCCSEAAWTAKS